MIRAGIVMAIAKAESRLTRRLVRYWVFTVLGALLTGVTFAWYAIIHAQFSWRSASAAAINPRFLVSSFGGIFLLWFLIALIFLGYDLRARDTRERMAEVLDALPCSNLELLLGKFAGILVPSWIPVLVILGLLEGVGLIIGWPIEPMSMAGLMIFMAIPGFAFTLGMVYLVTILVGHRLVAALISVGIIVGIFVGSNWVPLYLLPYMDITGGLSFPFPSDLFPTITTGPAALQRLAFLLAGIGMVWLAAAFHPRRDDSSRGMTAAVGGALVLIWLAAASFQVLQYKNELDGHASWRAAHEQRRDELSPDLLTMGGEIVVRPGDGIAMELDLLIRAPQGESLDKALFTLNPGMVVSAVTNDSGGTLEFDQRDGMLTIRLGTPIADDGTRSIHISVAGTPDAKFAYFDAAFELLELEPPDANMLILGRDPMVFDSRFVVLLPGLRWLPSSGTEVGPTGANGRPSDFYTVDLTFDLPEGWLAAGPGRRQSAGESGDRARFRFAPPAPVPDVALVAAPFESLSTEVAGVTLEVLYHTSHAPNFEVFEEGGAEIHRWLDERMQEAADVGLVYPYDAMTLVEVPNRLRGYGGGWRMDTTLTQPTMILMRESSFPTAHFANRFENAENFSRFDGGVPEGMRRTLEAFFENDLNGGNPFVGAARNFFSYQTDGVGPEGLSLDFVYESLSTKLLADKLSYFSVHFFDRNFGQRFGEAANQMNSDDRYSNSYSDVLVHMIISRAEVWDSIAEVSLKEIDPWEDPAKTIDALSLKGGAMAASMLDGLGREKAGAFLAALRSRTAGGSFDREDVIAAGNEIGVDLESWVEIWLDETALPGFAVGEVTVDRIADDEDGTPRYQTLVTVRDDEKVPGLLLVEYSAGDAESGVERGASDPVEVPAETAVEVGLITSKPVTRLRIKPYLSLNREPFNIPLPGLDEERIVDREPFVGVREVDWAPADGGWIVIDDLDDGFDIEERGGKSLRIAGKGVGKIETDRGLPVYANVGRLPAHWSRNSKSTAWGKYRKTVALIKAGSGERIAVFQTEMPRSGRYRLEYHLPHPGRGKREKNRGSWTMNLVDVSGDQVITFDADTADNGWNPLGEFELAAGEVRLEVSDKTDGSIVIADAIRWVPASSGAEVNTGP